MARLIQWPVRTQQPLCPRRPGTEKAKYLYTLVVESGVREVVARSVSLLVRKIATSVVPSA